MSVIKYNPTIEEFIEFFAELYQRCFIKYNEIDEILQFNAARYGFEDKLPEIKRAVKSKSKCGSF